LIGLYEALPETPLEEFPALLQSSSWILCVLLLRGGKEKGNGGKKGGNEEKRGNEWGREKEGKGSRPLNLHFRLRHWG